MHKTTTIENKPKDIEKCRAKNNAALTRDTYSVRDLCMLSNIQQKHTLLTTR